MAAEAKGWEERRLFRGLLLKAAEAKLLGSRQRPRTGAAPLGLAASGRDGAGRRGPRLRGATLSPRQC
jgi:hypothetical protein